jgi:hypothetical protein
MFVDATHPAGVVDVQPGSGVSPTVSKPIVAGVELAAGGEQHLVGLSCTAIVQTTGPPCGGSQL